MVPAWSNLDCVKQTVCGRTLSVHHLLATMLCAHHIQLAIR